MLKNKLICWTQVLFILIGPLCHAFATNNTTDYQTEHEIQSIIEHLKQRPKQNLPNKLDHITQFWINRPYQLYCLGEGTDGEFDQRPFFRTDAFDCETFVDMALALSYAKDTSSFKEYVKSIRYANGIVEFTHRNHFTNIDWNRNNQNQHFLKDITGSITVNGIPITTTNKIFINKKQWYVMMKPNRIFLTDANAKTLEKKLEELRRKSEKESIYESVLTYIPIKCLFDQNEHPIHELFKQIPHGSILQLVTPQSHTEDLIGTELDISHLGFVFHKDGQIFFRHASFTHKKVETVLLVDYLKSLLHHKTIKGIHIEMPQEMN